jgi:hypothetical protein
MRDMTPESGFLQTLNLVTPNITTMPTRGRCAANAQAESRRPSAYQCTDGIDAVLQAEHVELSVPF